MGDPHWLPAGKCGGGPFPHAQVVGDVGPSLALLADRQEDKLKTAAALVPLRQEILARITDRGDRGPLSVDATSHPTQRAPGHAGGRHRGSRQRHTRSGLRAIIARVWRIRCCRTTRWRDGGGAAEHRGNEGRVCQAAGLEKRARTTGRSGGHHAAVLASVLSIRSSSTRVSDILDEEVDFGRLRVETLRSGWSGATF